MSEKIYKTISKEEYERLKSVNWETAQGELFYRTTAIRRYWRPAMAWLYFCIVFLDFIVFPILWVQFGKGEYHPMTLQGGGLFHISMGAIVATASIGRTWEKIDQYKIDRYGPGMGYDNMYRDPYSNPTQPYPGSPSVQMAPTDKLGDALSNNEDEIIPPNAGIK